MSDPNAQLVQDTIERQHGAVETDGMFALQELLSLIPKDHTFTLPSGATARFEVFVSAKLRDGRPYAMVDAKMAGGVCDHFGFGISLTDQGGAT